MRATSIRPITDLKTHTKEVIDQAIHSGEPVLITQNGRASVVVIDAKRHDDAQATLAMLKLLAQSQDSLAEATRPIRARMSDVEHTRQSGKPASDEVA